MDNQYSECKGQGCAPVPNVPQPDIPNMVFDQGMNQGLVDLRTARYYLQGLMEAKNDAAWQHEMAAGVLRRQVKRIWRQINEDVPIPGDRE